MNRWGTALALAAAVILLGCLWLSTDPGASTATAQLQVVTNAPAAPPTTAGFAAPPQRTASAEPAGSSVNPTVRRINPGPVTSLPKPGSVPLSYEHRELIKFLLDDPKNPHANLEAEPKDAAWAFSVEHAVKVGFEEEASKGYEVYSAECRTTVCEFQLFAPEGTEMEELSEALRRYLPMEPVGLSFGSGAPGGKVALISFVHKNDMRGLFRRPPTPPRVGGSKQE